MENTTTCISCEQEINEDEASVTTDEGEVCNSCRIDALGNASTTYVVNTEGETKRFTITPFETIDEDPDIESDSLTFSRVWNDTGGYRGHFSTAIEGWKILPGLDGWSTGWIDETVTRKEAFNDWFEGIIGGEGEPSPVPFAIVTDPTSNVFSTSISVLCKEEDAFEFSNWLGTHRTVLAHALS